jgi:hypothetical protein
MMLGFSFRRTSIPAAKMGNANLQLLISAFALLLVSVGQQSLEFDLPGSICPHQPQFTPFGHVGRGNPSRTCRSLANTVCRPFFQWQSAPSDREGAGSIG